MVSFAGSSRGVSVDLSTHRWSYVARIMPLGDSITSGFKSPDGSGYRGPLWSKFYGSGLGIDYVGQYQDGPSTFLDPDHQGGLGQTADGLIGLVPGLMTRYKPDIVLLMIGSNDISEDRDSPSQLHSELKQFLDKIAANRSSATIFVSTLTPLASDQPGSNLIPAANREIKAAVAEAARKGQHVELVEPKLSLSDLVDGVHPDEGGHTKLAQAWYSAVMRELPAQGGTPGGHAVALSSNERNISGSVGADRLAVNHLSKYIYGRSSNDVIVGKDGNDRLDGGSGVDLLNGGAGNDVLYGRLGADRLYGSLGADVFTFGSVKESTVSSTGRDTIYDFSLSQKDKLDLSAIDARTTSSGNQAFSFIGDNGFHDKAGELRYEKYGTGIMVSGDITGDGRADFSILLRDVSSISKGYFIL